MWRGAAPRKSQQGTLNKNPSKLSTGKRTPSGVISSKNIKYAASNEEAKLNIINAQPQIIQGKAHTIKIETNTQDNNI